MNEKIRMMVSPGAMMGSFVAAVMSTVGLFSWRCIEKLEQMEKVLLTHVAVDVEKDRLVERLEERVGRLERYRFNGREDFYGKKD